MVTLLTWSLNKTRLKKCLEGRELKKQQPFTDCCCTYNFICALIFRTVGLGPMLFLQRALVLLAFGPCLLLVLAGIFVKAASLPVLASWFMALLFFPVGLF